MRSTAKCGAHMLETVRVIVRGEGEYRGEQGGFDLAERARA